jgi:LsmAD domain
VSVSVCLSVIGGLLAGFFIGGSEALAHADRVAAELEGLHSDNVHEREERGLVDDSGMDEEDKYSGVVRPGSYVPPHRRPVAALDPTPVPVAPVPVDPVPVDPVPVDPVPVDPAPAPAPAASVTPAPAVAVDTSPAVKGKLSADAKEFRPKMIPLPLPQPGGIPMYAPPPGQYFTSAYPGPGVYHTPPPMQYTPPFPGVPVYGGPPPQFIAGPMPPRGHMPAPSFYPGMPPAAGPRH